MNSQNKIPAGLWLPFLLLTIAALLALSGCTSTIIPTHTEASAPSFDPSGGQNSGFLGWTTNGGVVYGVLTTDACARYLILVAKYGKDFDPPMDFDTCYMKWGQNQFWITQQNLVRFETMERWKKENKKP